MGLRPLRLQWNPETVLGLQRFFSFHTRPQHRQGSSSSAARAHQARQPQPQALPDPSPPRPGQEATATGGSLASAGAGAGHELAASFLSPMSASLYFASNDGSVILALPPGASAGAAGAPDAGPPRACRLRLAARLEAVEVLLNKEGELRRLLGLRFSSAALSFAAATGGDKQLVGTIEGLVVTDLGNLDTCFPRVLGAAEGAPDAALVVRLKYTSVGGSSAAAAAAEGSAAEEAAAVAAKAAAPVRADNLLEVDVGPLQVVYFNHLSLEVIDYLCEGVLAALVTGALRSADALVRQRALAKTGFAIRMARPRCILPRLLVRVHVTALSEPLARMVFGLISLAIHPRTHRATRTTPWRPSTRPRSRRSSTSRPSASSAPLTAAATASQAALSSSSHQAPAASSRPRSGRRPSSSGASSSGSRAWRSASSPRRWRATRACWRRR